MKTRLTPACVLLGALLVSGCGSADESSQSTEQATSPQKPPVQTQPPVGIETRTDTIASIHQQVPEPETATKTPYTPSAFYQIQVGAFRKAANATAWESVVRRRLGLPTVSEYSERIGFYRVRVGAFETQREVISYWRKIRKEYPREFGDSWVILPGRE